MKPKRIGPYAILGRLGAGGMSEVFLARQEDPIRRLVALKLLRPGVDSREVLRRFGLERRALAALNHPHIAKVYDAGEAGDGRPYIVLERVEGEPIDAFCRRHTLDVRARLELMRQVCGAVEHAHHKGIVHRDLKPTNILVSGEQASAACKVIDFGVARDTTGVLAGETLLTQPGQRVGTPAYMAPEQSGLALDVDTRADVYSLGVILYELLTGRRPLGERLERATTPVELEQVLHHVTARPPSSLTTGLARDLDWITLKALEADRERRYGSPAELARDLERYLAREPIAARPPSRGYQLGRFISRNRVASITGALILVTLAIGLVTTGVFYAEARSALQRERSLAGDLARLSDLNLLREAERVAASLWPAHPDRLGPLKAWTQDYARPLASRRAEHRARLEELESASGRGGVEHADAWERATLAELLDDLERFLDPDPWRGLAAEVRVRIEASERVREMMDDAGHQATWRATSAGIRASPHYGGFELAQQVGLLPLGENPSTGLWEFWHVESGEAPLPESDPSSPNVWRITGTTGIVLVLLPGGPYVLGSQSTDPLSPRYDPRRGGVPSILSPDPVDLAPFFISKYELTQGQWLRVMGSNPSRHAVDGATHPVERVSWHDGREALRRLGLQLPTEVQWEYAARGGTDTIWWCGDREQSLAGCANIADRTLADAGMLRIYEPTTSVDDGWVLHAPVGSFRANGFGLHDVAGNLYEWCRDLYGTHGFPRHPGDGLTTNLPGQVEEYVDRGGSFRRPAFQARSAEQDYFPAETRLDYLGLRPARVLDPR